MKLKPSFRPDMHSETTACTFTSTGSPSTSFAWELCTPTSRPTMHGLFRDLGTTLVPNMEHMHTDYEYMPNMKTSSQQSLDSSAPSDSSGMYGTSSRVANGAGLFAMAYPHNLSGSGIADCSSSWTHDTFVTLFLQQRGLDSERHSQPLTGCYSLHKAPASHDRLCADPKMAVHESQSMIPEVQLVQNQTSKIFVQKGSWWRCHPQCQIQMRLLWVRQGVRCQQTPKKTQANVCRAMSLESCAI